MTDRDEASDLVSAMLDLGFSQYEARCYVGLLGPEAQTGYGVAKTTGVPQPKVYEALRKLVSRGAARELGGSPVRFVAVPPEQLLADLRASYQQKLEVALETSRHVVAAGSGGGLEHVDRLESVGQVHDAAAASLAAADRRVYLSASPAELKALRQPIEDAVARGVDMVVVSFGRTPLAVAGLRVFRHASTDGAVFRRHQARHLALVADSRRTVFGVAPDGDAWQAVATSSFPVIAAVKGFIRHDIDIQQVYADFGPQLVEAYGPGLQELESYRQEQPATERSGGADVPTEVTATKARRRKTG